jgi:hypothetical protein
MATREERLAQNQRTFGDANERFGEVVSRAELDGNIVPFLCECADEFCLGRIELSLSQYEDTHLLPNTYVILPGHPRIEGEEVVEHLGTFLVVQKG